MKELPDTIFPNAPTDWTPEKAQAMANEIGIELTQNHWEAIAGLQEFFEKNTASSRRKLVDALDEKFHSQGGTRYLYELFPGGPVSQGCALAGLAIPAGSVDPSFGSVV